VAVRPSMRETFGRYNHRGVDFYDPERVCAAAPLRDNLLFGRINKSIANAQTRVATVIGAVVDELGMRQEVEGVGLDHQVGPAGRLLTAQQRASVNLIRCLVKRPDVLVLDGALTPFGEERARALLALLLPMFEEHSLLAVLPNDRDAGRFDALVRFRNGQAVVERRERQIAAPAAAE
jgi:putative ABC transport system ATP-binding protein